MRLEQVERVEKLLIYPVPAGDHSMIGRIAVQKTHSFPCAFCGSSKDTQVFKHKFVCRECLTAIQQTTCF